MLCSQPWKVQKTKSYFTVPKSGKPRFITPQDDQFIKITYLRNRTAIAANIQSWINAIRYKTISKITVRFWKGELQFLNHCCILKLISAKDCYRQRNSRTTVETATLSFRPLAAYLLIVLLIVFSRVAFISWHSYLCSNLSLWVT